VAGAEHLALGGDPAAPLAGDEARDAASAVGGDARDRIEGVYRRSAGQVRGQRGRRGRRAGRLHGALSQRLSEWERPALDRVISVHPSTHLRHGHDWAFAVVGGAMDPAFERALVEDREHPRQEPQPVGRGLISRIAAQPGPEECRGVTEHGRVVARGPGEAQGRELDVLRRTSAAQLAAALTDLLGELHQWRLGGMSPMSLSWQGAQSHQLG